MTITQPKGEPKKFLRKHCVVFQEKSLFSIFLFAFVSRLVYLYAFYLLSRPFSLISYLLPSCDALVPQSSVCIPFEAHISLRRLNVLKDVENRQQKRNSIEFPIGIFTTILKLRFVYAYILPHYTHKTKNI